MCPLDAIDAKLAELKKQFHQLSNEQFQFAANLIVLRETLEEKYSFLEYFSSSTFFF